MDLFCSKRMITGLSRNVRLSPALDQEFGLADRPFGEGIRATKDGRVQLSCSDTS